MSLAVNLSPNFPNHAAPEDLLKEAIFDVIQQTPIVDTYATQRRSLLVVSAVIAGTTKYFFIPASMKLPAGALWASSNCLGWFVLEFGFAYEFIQDLMKPTLQSEEAVLAHCKLSRTTKVCIAIPALSLGAFSQLTAALQALKYNTQSSKWLVTGITSISTGFYPAVSIQNGIVSAYDKINRIHTEKSEFEDKLLAVKTMMLNLINFNFRAFSKLSITDKGSQVIELSTALSHLSEDERYTTFMRYLLVSLKQKRKVIRQENTTTCQKIGQVLKKITALFFTASAEVAGSIYTLECAKESFNYDNDPFARSMSALYAGTSFYLTWKLNDWMMNYISDTAQCKRERSTAEQMYPLATNMFASIAFIVDFLSQGAVWQIWKDFSEEKNYNESSELYFQMTQCAGTFLILYASTLGSIRTFLEFYNEKQGKEGSKEILLLEKQYKKISLLIEKSSFLHFAIYLSNFPESLKKDILTDLLNEHQITSQAISDYINQKFGRREQLMQPLLANK